MTHFFKRILTGKDTTINGIFALGFIAAVALGCTCGKELGGLANTETTSNQSNTTNTSSTTTRPNETKPNASKGALPADGELQYLVRETMLSFNDAIQKADFDDFYSNISKQWQKQTNAQEMQSQFQSFIDGQASFGEISDMTANIKSKDTRKQSGYNVLDIKGEYSTTPIATTFDLSYVAEGSDWKLYKIQVYTGIRKR